MSRPTPCVPSPTLRVSSQSVSILSLETPFPWWVDHVYRVVGPPLQLPSLHTTPTKTSPSFFIFWFWSPVKVLLPGHKPTTTVLIPRSSFLVHGRDRRWNVKGRPHGVTVSLYLSGPFPLYTKRLGTGILVSHIFRLKTPTLCYIFDRPSHLLLHTNGHLVINFPRSLNYKLVL